jgi:hypothetical protein
MSERQPNIQTDDKGRKYIEVTSTMTVKQLLEGMNLPNDGEYKLIAFKGGKFVGQAFPGMQLEPTDKLIMMMNHPGG